MGRPKKIITQKFLTDTEVSNLEGTWIDESFIKIPVVTTNTDVYYKDEEGNEHLNFSKWDSYTVKKKDHKLDELIEEVEEGEMPLKSYTITHGDLTDSQQAQMIAWAKQVRANYNIK